MDEIKRAKTEQMRHYLEEFCYNTGRGHSFLASSTLPDPSHLNMPTVVLPKQTLVRFRNDYLLLLDFAALMCGKPIDELCGMDLLAPFISELQEDE